MNERRNIQDVNHIRVGAAAYNVQMSPLYLFFFFSFFFWWYSNRENKSVYNEVIATWK